MIWNPFGSRFLAFAISLSTRNDSSQFSGNPEIFWKEPGKVHKFALIARGSVATPPIDSAEFAGDLIICIFELTRTTLKCQGTGMKRLVPQLIIKFLAEVLMDCVADLSRLLMKPMNINFRSMKSLDLRSASIQRLKCR